MRTMKLKVNVTVTSEDTVKNIFIKMVLSYTDSIFEKEISTSKKFAKNQCLFKNIVVEPQTLTVYIFPSAPSGSTLPDNDYKDYFVRLRTYKAIDEQHIYINHTVSTTNLAKAGFIYDRNGDGNSAHGHIHVRCPFCNMSRSTQELGGNFQEYHRTEAPHCPFVPTFEDEGSYWEMLFLTTPTGNDNNSDRDAKSVLGLRYPTISADITLATLNNTASGGILSTTHATQVSTARMTATSSSANLVSNPLAHAASVPARNENSALSISAGVVVGLSNSLISSASSSLLNASESHGVYTDTTPSDTISQSALNSSENTVKGNTGSPTYSKLGIVTERPKRFEYALLAKRMETFSTWPRDYRSLAENLADAGFYYAGYGDCARCFYCGGGLRNWEDEDDVWVEHARWFPKCAYIRQQMGQVFVDTVQKLNKTNDHVMLHLDLKDNALKRDPAVKTLLNMGYPLDEIMSVARAILDDGNILSADKILCKLVCKNVRRKTSLNNVEMDKTECQTEEKIAAETEKLRTLKEQNNQLRQQTLCKICLVKEVAVVFLPCGHFISCTDCAVAMKDCPVCKRQVKGIVRAFIG